MARVSAVAVIFILVLMSNAPSFEARKMLTNHLNSPPSYSGDAGHENGMSNYEKFIATHLARIDRILQSTPSPGAGHSHY